MVIILVFRLSSAEGVFAAESVRAYLEEFVAFSV
jgi:hypothetical protein